MTDYEISRPTGRCCVTGRLLAEGESFWSAVFETPQGFERRDYSEDCWQGAPQGALCFFRTRVPKKEEPRRTFVDNEALLGFFLRLAGATEPIKQGFRFVLALILLRKRVLRYERSVREQEQEFLELRLVRDKSLHRLLNPQLDERQIEALTAQLSSVMVGGVNTDDSAAMDPLTEPQEQPG